MTPDELKQTHAALDAQEAGKPVQYKDSAGVWEDWTHVIRTPHRPKPSPEPVPWSLEEHPGTVWVRPKAQIHETHCLILQWAKTNAYVAGYGWVPYDLLLEKWEQLDGSPCERVG